MTIINRDHQFIFLKSRKTAGSSLELHLIKNTALGNDIYCTVPEAPDYGLPSRKRGSVLRLFGFYAYFDAHRSIRKRLPKIRQHTTAREVKALVAPAFWEKALKVCGVRNPWDLLFSYWRWRSRGSDGAREAFDVPFEVWARAAISGDAERVKKTHSVHAERLLHDFLFADGTVVPDHMVRFESLDSGLLEMSNLLNMRIPPMEIHEKASPIVEYRSHYSSTLADEVGDFFSDVIDLTGYSF